MSAITKWNAAGFEAVQWSHRGTACATGAANLTTANTNTSSAFARYRGANSAPFELPAPTVLNIPGDDGTRSVFQFDSDAFPTFVLEMSDMDTAFKTAAEGMATVTDGDMESTPIAFSGTTRNDLILVLSRKLKSQKAGQVGAMGYEHLVLLNCEATYLGTGYTTKGAATYRYQVTCNPSSFLPDGRTVASVYSDAPNSELGALLITTDYRFTYSVFVGDNAAASPVLVQSPISVAKSKATIETTGFAADTVAAVDLVTPFGYTLTTTPASGKFAVLRYEFNNWI